MHRSSAWKAYLERLTAGASFWRGAVRPFDMAFLEPSGPMLPRAADGLRLDWEAVGDDMWGAIDAQRLRLSGE